MIRTIIATVALLCGMAAASPPASAHGGGLNAEGCHNDRKNGGYHCHRAPSRPRPASSPAEFRDNDGIGCE